MYSGEYDSCDVTLSVYPHRESLKNMPDHGGNQTYDLRNTSPMLCQLSYPVYPGSRGLFLLFSLRRGEEKINVWLKAAIDSSSRANQFELGSDPDSVS